jgi:hypothetical protein
VSARNGIDAGEKRKISTPIMCQLDLATLLAELVFLFGSRINIFNIYNFTFSSNTNIYEYWKQTNATTITQNSSQHRVKYKSLSLKLFSHIAKTRIESLRVNERNSYQKSDPTRKINIERHNRKLKIMKHKRHNVIMTDFQKGIVHLHVRRKRNHTYKGKVKLKFRLITGHEGAEGE